MGQPLYILIVEDSEDDTDLVLRELQRGGYDVTHKRVDTAHDMSAALENQGWDVVIADYAMPHFDGLSALTLTQEKSLDLPFIIVSGRIGEEVAINAMKAGAHDYIMKDNLTRLVPVIERELKEAGVRQARRQAEQALRESEAKYRALAESSPIGIFISDLDRFIYVNPRLCEITGYSSDEILNMLNPVETLIAHEGQEQVLVNALSRISGGQAPTSYEIRGIRKDGEEVWLNLSVSTIELGGRRVLQGAVEDITGRKRAEETLQTRNLDMKLLHELDELRSELIANVSHELRTPLGLIKATSSALLMDDIEIEPEMRRELLEDISTESDKLEKIVNDLLMISRIESDRLYLEVKHVDLGEIAQQEAQEMKTLFPRHEIEYHFPTRLLVMEADASQVKQVFRNLLSNAAKYSPEGSKITIRGLKKVDQILIRVEDHGIGIPEEELEKVFERFYRLDNEITRRVGGVGLGLALCRGIVEAHGGKIWAESTPGEGCVFNVAFPIPNPESLP